MNARALVMIAWVAGGVAWAALILLLQWLFLVAGIVSAAATLVWGYQTPPTTDPDEWASDEWWHEPEPGRA